MSVMEASLSDEQKYAFELFKEGNNLFISGPGGVGKSYLIEKMVEYASTKNLNISVTALTGCAAVLLGTKARTIHAWSGINFMSNSTDDELIIRRIARAKDKAGRWKKCDILIVDEVSMMPVRMFNILNAIGQTTRRSPKPFGGIQVIFTGDFYQLPPVCPHEETQFCFESSEWYNTFPLENHIELRTFFRQTDPEFIKILMEVRSGELKPDSIERLISLVGKEKPSDDECFITKIFPTRSKVDTTNRLMFDRLKGDIRVFHSVKNTDEIYYYITSGREDQILIEPEILLKCDELPAEMKKREVDSLIPNYNIIEELSLKVGALVMLTVNIDVERGLCNGSQGIIEGFEAITGFPIVRFTNRLVRTVKPNVYQSAEFPRFTVTQVPLCLAWSLTIHKTQGATLSQIEVDIGSSVFEYGQTYVAISRVKTLNGLYLTNFDPKKIRANPKVKAFYLKTRSNGSQYRSSNIETVNDPEEVDVDESNDGRAEEVNKIVELVDDVKIIKLR